MPRLPRIVAALALGISATAFAADVPAEKKGEKIQLTTPEKVPLLPGKENPGARRAVPFSFLDRDSSVGGVVDVPSVAPSASPTTLDPRSQRRLLEAYDKKKNWSLDEDGGFRKKEPSDPSWQDELDADLSESQERSLFLRALLRDEKGMKTGKDGSEEESDGRLEDDGDPNRDLDLDREGGRDDESRLNKRGDRPRESVRASSTDKPPSAAVDGERVMFSDPFSPVNRGPAERLSDGGFDTRSRTVHVVSPADLQRSQEFRQLLVGDGTGPKPSDGPVTFGSTASERSENFRSLLGNGPGSSISAPSASAAPVSVLDLNKAASPAVPTAPKTALPGTLLPTGAGFGSSLAPPPSRSAPLIRPQPAILPIPRRY